MIEARWEISGGNQVPLTLATFAKRRKPNETKTSHAAERERRDFPKSRKMRKRAHIAKSDLL
jgi:hypothetical protein